MYLLPVDCRCGFSSFPDWCDLVKQVFPSDPGWSTGLISSPGSTGAVHTPTNLSAKQNVSNLCVLDPRADHLLFFPRCLACSVSQ